LTFFAKNTPIIWLYQKKVVILHAFSRFGLPSSAAKGTDDGEELLENLWNF
jgi:hypothetical protein